MKILPSFEKGYDPKEYLEIRSSENCTRVLVQKKDLLELIKSGSNQDLSSLIDLPERNSTNDAEVDEWRRFNWGESLEYYQWSRRSEFYDSKVDSEERLTSQKELIQKYIKNVGEIPLPRQLSNDNHAISLDKYSGAIPICTFGDALVERSCSKHSSKSTLKLDEMSSILFHSFSDIRKHRIPKEGKGLMSDVLKSFGRSFEFYLVVYDPELIASGIYFFDPVSHSIKMGKAGEYRSEMVDILIGHSAPKTASCSLIMVQEFEISQWQYKHERALRNLYFEVGRIMQRILVAASYYRKNTHITPACKDSEATKLLDLSESQQVFYTITLA